MKSVVNERTRLEIGIIVLDWSPWTPWPDVLLDDRGGAGMSIPNHVPGVYEVRHADHEAGERLHIGRASERFHPDLGAARRNLSGILPGARTAHTLRLEQVQRGTGPLVRPRGRVPPRRVPELAPAGWIEGGLGRVGAIACSVEASSASFTRARRNI